MAKIETLGDKPILGDVDEMLIAYLPKDNILFASDIISIPPAEPLPPGRPANRDLVDKLKKLGIDVQIIAPGRGRMETIQDLQRRSTPGFRAEVRPLHRGVAVVSRRCRVVLGAPACECLHHAVCAWCVRRVGVREALLLADCHF